eukprot:TRINITY_DN73536_c0_g1_i1.p1 TRINITY_DN73536_c0_g1~~TRINITY_DN73536_c0_g1_i1.p1  ORF type:complete len:359 (+),score=46.50 TRINITY_DN73536_c0_g1_i1:121-1077(+)
MEGDGNGDVEKHTLAARLGDLSRAKFFTVRPSELQIQGLLGRGAEAEVYKAEWTRTFAGCTSTIVVALKMLHMNLDPIYRDREAVSIVTEHPNLLKCFDSTNDPPYMLVGEYCAGGSLFNLLYNSKQELSLCQRVKILADVASGMRYLHAQEPRILHRDLKSSNVLLTKPIASIDQEPTVKVADFGLSRLTDGGKDTAMTAGVGTWQWMAPEVFEFSGCAYDWRADVFSFGILMYEVFVRRLPYFDHRFLSDGDPRVALHVCNGLRPSLSHVPTDYPKELTDLAEQCWAGNPGERPAFEEIMSRLKDLLNLQIRRLKD